MYQVMMHNVTWLMVLVLHVTDNCKLAPSHHSTNFDLIKNHSITAFIILSIILNEPNMNKNQLNK